MKGTARQTLTRAALQFRHALHGAAGNAQRIRPHQAVLFVAAGIHRHARLRLRASPVSVSSQSHAAIVVRDLAIQGDQLSIEWRNDHWALRAGDSGKVMEPDNRQQQARFVRDEYRFGNATLLLSQRTGTWTRVEKRRPDRWWLGVFMPAGVGMLVLGAALAVAGLKSPTPLALGLAQFDPSAWPDVRIEAHGGGLTIHGFVTDAGEREALLAALTSANGGPPAGAVRTGSELAGQVRSVLAEDGLTVRYAGSGVVQILGEVRRQSVVDRIDWLRNEMAPVVQIDDLTEYVEPRREPVKHPLPFRIVDVIPGEGGSFGDENGARYFVGARLPDGAVVRAVDRDSVEFSKNGLSVRYPLK